MAGPSAASSVDSSNDFSLSRFPANGNSGVISSVIWLTIAAGLCFPWLLEQPPASKAGDSPKSVAWFLVLALDLVIGTMSVFSLWFQKSTLSIMLLVWGACAILATFVVASFAMLPAVATMCCCAPELCTAGAADTTALDDTFCFIPMDLCMETKWSMWCYYGGILLGMISIVLLVNSVGLHHKILLECERLRNEAAKAARAAHRARRRRQELWEQEVYGGFSAHSASTTRDRRSPHSVIDEHAITPKQGNSRSSAIDARGLQSLTLSPSRPSAPRAMSEIEAGRVTPPTPLAPLAMRSDDGMMERLGSPTSAPLSNGNSSSVGRDGGHSVDAYPGRQSGRKKNFDEEEQVDKPWGKKGPPLQDVVMSWVAEDANEGGRITPKTALRFKTSALARAMHN